MFVLGYVYTVTWLNLDHKPTLDILARTLHLHSSQIVLIRVATIWQRVWAGKCKQHFKVLMKSSLNLSSAGLDCGNASGLLQGKGIPTNTAETVQANPVALHWSSEDGLTDSGDAQSQYTQREHPQPHCHTSRGRAGSRQHDRSHAAYVLWDKPLTNLDLSALQEAGQPTGGCDWFRELFAARVQVNVICTKLLLSPGLNQWGAGALTASTSLAWQAGQVPLPPSCGAGMFL